MIGMEPTFEEHVENLVSVFDEVRRVLRPDGTLWLNYGDAYWSNPSNGRGSAGSALGGGEPHLSGAERKGKWLKPKDLMLMPARVAMALQEAGWWLRSEIIWHKPNPMPESVTDRPTSAHEKVFLFSKKPTYFYDAEAVRLPATGRTDAISSFGRNVNERNDQNRVGAYKPDGRVGANLRNVWKIATAPFKSSHFATFPPALVEPCIKAGTSKHGVCSECGAPWARETEKSVSFESGSGRSGNPISGKWDGTEETTSGTYDIRRGPVTAHKTTGWRPTCECVHRWCDECATVLDCVQDVEIRDGCIHGEKAEPEHTGVRLRGVREAVHARQDQNPQGRALFQDVRGEIQRTEQVNDEGLDDHDHGIPDAASEGPSECDEVRVCDGAQAGSGGVSRQAPDPRRSGASHERQQAGQSDREPATDDEAGARRLQEADVLRDVPVLQPRLPGAGECPHCGRGARWKLPDTKPSVVLDCFGGAGTVGLVADRLQRDAVLIEISGDYAGMARKRIEKDAGMFASIASRMTAKGKG